MDKYFVFMVFYKKGKYKVKEFDTEDEMEDFLIIYLTKHSKYCNIKNFRGVSLFGLIHEALKVGSIVLDERAGYGIVKAIGGEDIQDSTDDEEEEEEYIESFEEDSESEECEEDSEECEEDSEECEVFEDGFEVVEL
jgi:hypothetical protein